MNKLFVKIEFNIAILRRSARRVLTFDKTFIYFGYLFPRNDSNSLCVIVANQLVDWILLQKVQVY